MPNNWDATIRFNGGRDEEHGQPYARTLWNKIDATIAPEENLQNHEILERVLEEISQ